MCALCCYSCTHGQYRQFHRRIKCSDGVDAQINYLQAPGHGTRPYLAMGAASASSPGFGEPVQYAPQARFICDARREQPSLDREGAVLRRQETALRQQDCARELGAVLEACVGPEGVVFEEPFWPRS
eukprot:s3284_g5.t1